MRALRSEANWPMAEEDVGLRAVAHLTLLTSLRILVSQADLRVGHWDFTSRNEDLLHIGFHVEGVAVRNHDVGL